MNVHDAPAESAPRRETPSLLRRAGKALLFAAVAGAGLALSACAPNRVNMPPPVSIDGGPEAGPGGAPLGPRPDVRPSSGGGPAATGAPRAGGGLGGAVTIGLLVPESGRSRDQLALGTALRDAAQLALFDSGRDDVSIIIKDTGGSSARAAAAASQAIAEGAEILLGPVFAEDVAAVAAVARPQGVPVIAFSSDQTVARAGVYLLSFPPEEEVRQIVDYAASQGVAYYASLSPTDAYGRRAVRAFEDAVRAVGGQITASATYAGGQEAVYPSIMQLDGRPFEALFVPDGGSGLRTVAGLLKFGPPPPPAPKPLTPEEIAAGKTPPPPPPPPVRANLPSFTLLGTGLWDEAATGTSPGVAGGVFAAPEPGSRERFSARFNSNFGYRPARIASLGYDAVALVATLSGGDPVTRFSDSAIADPNGFAGVDGIFRFLPDGRIQRGLAIIEATGAGFRIRRSAPNSFQVLGF